MLKVLASGLGGWDWAFGFVKVAMLVMRKQLVPQHLKPSTIDLKPYINPCACKQLSFRQPLRSSKTVQSPVKILDARILRQT